MLLTLDVLVKKLLVSFINLNPDSPKVVVAESILKQEDILGYIEMVRYSEVENDFSKIFSCSSEAHQFYDRYYREIEAVHFDMEEWISEPLKPQEDSKAWYAWMAYKSCTSTLAREIGLGY